MEQSSGPGQQAAWRASFQRKYLSHLVAVLRRRRIDAGATRLSFRSRTVKLAADLSLAMTARGQTAWRRAIFCKYLFGLNKSRCNRRALNSRRNSEGKQINKSCCQRRLVNYRGISWAKQRSVSAKARPCKPIAFRHNSGTELRELESGLTGSRSLGSCRDNRDEVAGDTMDSRMQTLRLLVPGSRGLGTPVFLKEAADYIVALKMQVEAMQAFADYYSNSNAQAARHVSM